MPFQGWHVPGCSAFRVQFLQGKALPQTGTFQVHCKGLSGMEYCGRDQDVTHSRAAVQILGLLMTMHNPSTAQPGGLPASPSCACLPLHQALCSIPEDMCWL